mmetsp:Transcript_32899/g.83501  ORF Transcript_32899/g.83501 Transcript_32899/m.83501 type:complete len:323 (-) Transcript_32899:1744-2712(-)
MLLRASRSLVTARLHHHGACAATTPAHWPPLRALLQPPPPHPHRTLASAPSNTAANSTEDPKAALLVIGDEILSGSVTDTNTPWLAKLLHARGVDLVRVEVVRDSAADIREAALRLRDRVGPGGFVFTSGGIGPTHDDVTYEALAQAFGARLELHAATVERMRASYAARGMELNEARLRMATLPAPAEVLFTEGLWVPLVNLGGVYIAPGIPRLFQAMIGAHRERFTGRAYVSAALYSALGESFIADQLARVAVAHPQVAIGSYPNTSEQAEGAGQAAGWKTRLGLSSRSQAALDAALAALQAELPHLTPTPPPPGTPTQGL